MTTSPKGRMRASRCRKKRLRAYDHWLRTLSSRPSAAASADPAVPKAGPWPPGCERVDSLIANARVEEAVEDVCDEVEHDDDHRGDDKVRHDGVRVAAGQRIEEEDAETVEREDRLRDDRAPENAAEVERHDRDDRDHRVRDH